MAPDINSLPPSPFRNEYSTASPRQSHDLMASPATSRQASHRQSLSPTLREARISMSAEPSGLAGDNSGVGTGPGPLRHPRPLTAADLHMQMEKEQEAVVNRLTRELTLLRQQTASAVSTTSSTSTGLADAPDHALNPSTLGPNHPTSSRRHRSSSSLSSRQAGASTTATSAITGTSGSTVGTTGGVAGSSASGIAPPRDTAAPHSFARDPLSRQSSVASRRSQASSPSLSSSLIQGDHFPMTYGHRPSGSISQPPYQSTVQYTPSPASARPSHLPPPVSYEEDTRVRLELEDIKRENEALKRRIRELERAVSSRDRSEPAHTRTASVSTTASYPRAGSHNRLLDNDDDSVRMGESAGSVGVGGGH